MVICRSASKTCCWKSRKAGLAGFHGLERGLAVRLAQPVEFLP